MQDISDETLTMTLLLFTIGSALIMSLYYGFKD